MDIKLEDLEKSEFQDYGICKGITQEEIEWHIKVSGFRFCDPKEELTREEKQKIRDELIKRDREIKEREASKAMYCDIYDPFQPTL